MTLLVSWAGVDTHGTASIYIASDSRYSSGNTNFYDFGRKLFACKNWPDVFGYCGDVLFPSVALGQIVALADEGLLFTEQHSTAKKFEIVVNKLNDFVSCYPSDAYGLSKSGVSIIHASRHDTKGGGFSCNRIKWSIKSGWKATHVPMPGRSSVLVSDGSGKSSFDITFASFELTQNKGTSRNVFHAFSQTLMADQVQSVGGAPQLVGLIRKPRSSGINFGIIHDKKRYFLGAHIDNALGFNYVPWMNEQFERCDGATGKRLPNAQKQPLSN